MADLEEGEIVDEDDNYEKETMSRKRNRSSYQSSRNSSSRRGKKPRRLITVCRSSQSLHGVRNHSISRNQGGRGAKRRHKGRNEEKYRSSNINSDDTSLWVTLVANKRRRESKETKRNEIRSGNRENQIPRYKSVDPSGKNGTESSTGENTFDLTTSSHTNTGVTVKESGESSFDTAMGDISDSESIISIPVEHKSPELIVIDETDTSDAEDDDNVEELQLRRLALEGMVSRLGSAESTEKTTCISSSSENIVNTCCSTITIKSTTNTSMSMEGSIVTSSIANPDSDILIPSALRRDGSVVRGLDRLPSNLKAVDSINKDTTENYAGECSEAHPIQTLLSTRRSNNFKELTIACNDVDDRIQPLGLVSMNNHFSGLINCNEGLEEPVTYAPNLRTEEMQPNSNEAYFISPPGVYLNRPETYTDLAVPTSRENWMDRTTLFSKEIWTVPPPAPTTEVWTNKPVPSGPIWANQSINSVDIWRNNTSPQNTIDYRNPINPTRTSHGDLQGGQGWTNLISPTEQWTNNGTIQGPIQIWNPSMSSSATIFNAPFSIQDNSANLDEIEHNISGQFLCNPCALPPMPVPSPFWNNNMIRPLGPPPMEALPPTEFWHGPPMERPILPAPMHWTEQTPSPCHSEIWNNSSNEQGSAESSEKMNTNKRRVAYTDNGSLVITTTAADCFLLQAKSLTTNSGISQTMSVQTSSSSPRFSLSNTNSSQELEEQELRNQLLTDVRKKRATGSTWRARLAKISKSHSLLSPLKKSGSSATSTDSYLKPSNSPTLSGYSYCSTHPSLFSSSVSSMNLSNLSLESLPAVPVSKIPHSGNYTQSTAKKPFSNGRISNTRSVKCKKLEKFSVIGNLQITIPNKPVQPLIINVGNDSSSSEDDHKRNSVVTESTSAATNLTKKSNSGDVSARPHVHKTQEINSCRAIEIGSPPISCLPFPPNFQASLGLLLKTSRETAERNAEQQKETKRKSQLEILEQWKSKEIIRKSSTKSSPISNAQEMIPSVVKHLPPGKQVEYALLKAKIVEIQRVQEKEKSNISKSVTEKILPSPDNSKNSEIESTAISTKHDQTNLLLNNVTPMTGHPIAQVFKSQDVPRLTQEKENDNNGNINQVSSTTSSDVEKNSESNHSDETCPPKLTEISDTIQDSATTVSNPIANTSNDPADLNQSVDNINKDGENTLNSKQNYDIDSLIQSCSKVQMPEEEPIVPKVSESSFTETPAPTNNSSNSLYNNVVDERQELYLRQKLLKAALLRKMETSDIQLKLAKSENQLLSTRASTIQGVNALMDKVVRISDRKVSHRNMIAHVAELRDQLLKADQKLGLSKLTIEGMVTELVDASQVLQGNRVVCEKLAEECKAIGIKLSGKKYKVPERGGVEMISKLKEIELQAKTLTLASVTGELTPNYVKGVARPVPGSFQRIRQEYSTPVRGRGRGRGRRNFPIAYSPRGRGRPKRTTVAPTEQPSTVLASPDDKSKEGLTRHFFSAGSPQNEDVFLMPRHRYGDFVDETEIEKPADELFLNSFQEYRTPMSFKAQELGQTNEVDITKVDPAVTLCTFELKGMCHSDACPFQHLNRPTRN